MIYTDECEVQNITKTPQFGETTTGTPFKVKCREEANDRSKNAMEGNAYRYKRIYLIPPGTNIKVGDNIKTTMRQNVAITESYAKVDEVMPVGRFLPHHIEVRLYDV